VPHKGLLRKKRDRRPHTEETTLGQRGCAKSVNSIAMHPRAGLRFAARRAYLCTRRFLWSARPVLPAPQFATVSRNQKHSASSSLLDRHDDSAGLVDAAVRHSATRMRAALMVAEILPLLQVRLSLVMLVRK